MITETLLGLALLAATSTCDDPSTQEEYREDLRYMVEHWLPHCAPLDEAGKATVRGLLESAAASDREFDDGSFALTVLRAAATAGNGHDLAGFGLLGQMSRLPIRVWWFSDGLYVVKATEENADLLGARVETIGAFTSEEALAAAAPYLPGNAAWRKHRSIEFLTRMPLLAAIGATSRADEIAIVFALPDGGRLRRVLVPPTMTDPENNTLEPWKESIFRPGDAEPASDRWPHVLDSIEERPAYLRAAKNVRYEFFAEHQTAYVRIAGIRDTGGPASLQSALMDALHSVQRDAPRDVVIDLRYNTGGNFFHAIPFAFGIGVITPDDGRIFLLANRCTFSAAIVTMSIIKHEAGAKRVTVIGEPIGDALRFWSEGGYVTLPNSQILVTHRDGLHDMIDGCQPDEGCWWGAEAFEHGVADLDPAVHVRESFEDYASGTDVYLDAVWAWEAREGPEEPADQRRTGR